MQIRVLGQNISVGGVVWDLLPFESYLGFTVQPSTGWSPVQYLLDNGGIPAANQTYTFKDSEDNIKFQFDVEYLDATHFRIGFNYPYRPLSHWNKPFNGGDSGIDVNHISEDDLHRYDIIPFVSAVANPNLTFPDNRGVSFGMYKIDGVTPVFTDFDTVNYIWDADLTPARFTYDGGTEYPVFYNVSEQQVIFANNEYYDCLFMAFGEEIDEFDDDFATPQGGDGNYNFYSEPVGMPKLPSLSIVDTGIATIWLPDPSQAKSFASFLWSETFFDNVIKLIADPIENVIQYGSIPLNLSEYRGTAKEVKVGNVGTGVMMQPATQQFIAKKMGEVKIDEAWKTALDYEAGGTEVHCYLPYVGIIRMSASEVMNASAIILQYNIDLLSGDFVACIQIKKQFGDKCYLDSVLYQHAGNMMVRYPLTGANYGRMYPQIVSGAMNVAGGIASGNPGAVANGLVDAAVGLFSVPVQRTGGYTGSSAVLGVEQAYIILTQPRQVFDSRYPKYEGYPSYLSYQLKELSGFTKVESLIDNVVECTDSEREEIEKLLKEGVYL